MIAVSYFIAAKVRVYHRKESSYPPGTKLSTSMGVYADVISAVYARFPTERMSSTSAFSTAPCDCKTGTSLPF